MQRAFLILSILFLTVPTLPGCALQSSGRGSSGEVSVVEIPPGLVFPKGSAVGYKAMGKPGSLIRGAALSVRPLVSRGVPAPAGFQVYEQNGRYFREIPSQRRGESLVADLIAGRIYMVGPALAGRERVSLRTLCRFTIEPHAPPLDIPKICTQILCGATPFLAGSIARAAGPLPEGVSPSLQLGGPLPPSLCQTCTRPEGPRNEDADYHFVCPDTPVPTCSGGTVLFNADFEADMVGGPPASAPPGPPAGDSIFTSGKVKVISAPSKAVLLTRDTAHAVLDAVLAPGATATGTYCIQFKGRVAGATFSPALVEFLASNGAPAWRMRFGSDDTVLMTGSGNVVLADDFHVIRALRFDLDLDRKTFDLYVDGAPRAVGVPFLDPTFGTPARLHAQLWECLLECFPTELALDDIRVTKKK